MLLGVYVFKVNHHKWDVFCNSSYFLVIMLPITLGVPLEIKRRGRTGLLTSGVSIKSYGHPTGIGFLPSPADRADHGELIRSFQNKSDWEVTEV